MILQIVKELEAKNPFLTIDKCNNYVINYWNLPINNPKRDTLDTNAFAKFEWNSFKPENIIPATNVWRGIKKKNIFILYLNGANCITSNMGALLKERICSPREQILFL